MGERRTASESQLEHRGGPGSNRYSSCSPPVLPRHVSHPQNRDRRGTCSSQGIGSSRNLSPLSHLWVKEVSLRDVRVTGFPAAVGLELLRGRLAARHSSRRILHPRINHVVRRRPVQ
ncbi:hypothetical protein GN956_G2630 [Arapaima gigas]